MIAFIIWALCGAMFVGVGFSALFAKKPMGFWANARMFEVEDVKSYNRAVAKLWFVYGVVFIVMGLPLLQQNSPYIMLSVVGMMLETVGVMIVYTLVIDKKYWKK
ncbi:MAG: hypothetical protein J6J86_10620 [Lachnospiraceae bacterium]|nr:hypothetical protein [Lachnospiraceae bacterium]